MISTYLGILVRSEVIKIPSEINKKTKKQFGEPRHVVLLQAAVSTVAYPGP